MDEENIFKSSSLNFFSSSSSTTSSCSSSCSFSSTFSFTSPLTTVQNHCKPQRSTQKVQGEKSGNEDVKRQKNDCGIEKHPMCRGVRKRNWGKRNQGYGSEYIPLTRWQLVHMMLQLMAIKGHSAYLNFPHLAHQLPRPASASPKDIQSAAAWAASATFLSAGESTEVGMSKSKLSTSHSSTNLSLDNNIQEPHSTGFPVDDDDTFFDLPDLCKDQDVDGFRHYASSWQLIGTESGCRLEDTLSWECY